MRPLDELISADSAWPTIQGWIAASSLDVNVLPVSRVAGENALFTLQLSSHSTLGAVALETGGIIVDNGWLRFLGSGSHHMKTTLCSWNHLDGNRGDGFIDNAFVVAFDVIGGFFALNGGAWGKDRPGEVFYFAPDSLEWEALGIQYSDLLRWTFEGGVEKFYETMRWPTWKQESSKIDGDHGFIVTPPLWASGPDIALRTKNVVPQSELWDYQLSTARKIGSLPNGSRIKLRLE